MSAVVLILGGFDIVEIDVQDREQVVSGEKVEAQERKEGHKNDNKQRTLKHVTSWMTCRWCEMHTKDTLSHNVVCTQGESVREKLSCEVYRVLQRIGTFSLGVWQQKFLLQPTFFVTVRFTAPFLLYFWFWCC